MVPTTSGPTAVPTVVPTAVPTAFPTHTNSTFFRFYVSPDLLTSPVLHDFDMAGFETTIVSRLTGVYTVPEAAIEKVVSEMKFE